MRYGKGWIVLIQVILLTGCTTGEKELNPSGTLEATEIEIASEIAARITEVRPELGSFVQSGDTLIVLDTRLIGFQKDQVEASRGSIQAQIRVASDGLAQARDNLNLAETTLQRTTSLLQQGSATQQQVDELRTRRDNAKTALTSATHAIEGLQAEEARLDATLRVYDRQLEMGVILAPVDGVVLLRNAENGEMALPGQTLLKIGKVDRMELRVYLGETELDLVHIGQDCPVLIDVFEGDTLRGEVIWISSEAEFTPKNAQTRQARTQLVYAVKFRLLNRDRRLAIGMPAEVILPAGK
ncbi:HlyD family efflux transporter periplasmic adaptor subunit [bacterium]|nr:HlyD family efflux transporter periplasmic adaptor subunit [bacterium]